MLIYLSPLTYYIWAEFVSFFKIHFLFIYRLFYNSSLSSQLYHNEVKYLCSPESDVGIG